MTYYSKNELKLFLTNKTNAVKYITNKVYNMEQNKMFNDKLLLSIIQYHPYKDEKDISNFEYFMVMKRPPFNKPALHLKTLNKDIDDISYKQSIDKLFEKYDEEKENYYKILTAFRNSINDLKKKDFFNKNEKICVLCNTRDNLNIDHYPIPFSKILDDFIDIHNIDFYNLETIEIDNLNVLLNYEIKELFKVYHDNKVYYRFLCKSCNCSTGKGDYKPKYTFKNK